MFHGVKFNALDKSQNIQVPKSSDSSQASSIWDIRHQSVVQRPLQYPN